MFFQISITYDDQARASYIYLQPKKNVSKTLEVIKGVLNVDLDEYGTPLGIEVLYPHNSESGD